ncbi:unnamed protein product, partial [Owenia fusiformis]
GEFPTFTERFANHVWDNHPSEEFRYIVYCHQKLGESCVGPEARFMKAPQACGIPQLPAVPLFPIHKRAAKSASPQISCGTARITSLSCGTSVLTASHSLKI